MSIFHFIFIFPQENCNYVINGMSCVQRMSVSRTFNISLKYLLKKKVINGLK